jgi:hypothetical protein
MCRGATASRFPSSQLQRKNPKKKRRRRCATKQLGLALAIKTHVAASALDNTLFLRPFLRRLHFSSIYADGFRFL